ncbi:copper resistance protein B [Sphingomonas sp. 22176]|uniref:copper resistance protein B n=1 Tax=Sphingomonas sp. 22176 TaxID=3453884 RepID=UPI003F84CC81
MIRVALLAGLASLGLAAPALGQSMDHATMPGMAMPGMPMPAKKPAKARPKAKKPPARKTGARKASAQSAPPADPAADPHAGHDMSSMHMPGMAAGQAPAVDPHAGHDMSAMPGMPAAQSASPGAQGGDDSTGMPGMDMAPGQAMQHDMASMPGMVTAPAGTDRAPGNAPAPVPAATYLADRYWGAKAMADARENALRHVHGGMTYHQLLFNLAEIQLRKGGDGYRWDGEAWIGGDIDRLWLKSEGEGRFGKPLERGEVQALYSHALDPYWNLQAGVRYDVRPDPSRAYATVGVEGLAPYQLKLGGALFLSDKGEVLARAEGYYDQRVTNMFVLQPRVEANFSAQRVGETGTGAGLTDLEAGVRLRYEQRREFAPYIGLSWERQFGDTARFSRARGEETGGFSVVAGVRSWF